MTGASELDSAAALLDEADDVDDVDDGQAANVYPDVLDFVDGYLAPTFARHWQTGKEPRWCARWWEHPEAVVRFSALWLTWEAARLDPGAFSAWLREADHNLDRLTSAAGPFWQCGPARHSPPPAWPTTPPPPGARLDLQAPA